MIAAAPVERLAIVGVGLIGGSFALALRAAGLVRRVVGIGRSRATLEHALRLRIVDEIAADASGARGADVVFAAPPVGQMHAVLAGIAPHLREDAIVTDGGSTKRDVIAAARMTLGTRVARFVPGHPIAGSEQSGPSAASATLYARKQVILTPLAENPPAAVARVEALWRACGASVHRLSPDEHDSVLATVSHLPHVLAFALVEQMQRDPYAALSWRHAGAGFRDFSRIASSSPEMWRDVCLANRDALLERIDGYAAVLDELRASVAAGDGAALDRVFAAARDARDAWVAQHRDAGEDRAAE
jgi:prephenate dehydrogenase